MDVTKKQIKDVVARFIDPSLTNVIDYLSEEIMKLHGWKRWDKNEPPEHGYYMVFDPNFTTPVEQVWSFRPSDIHANRSCWYNNGNWIADRAPAFYCKLPRFPNSMLTAAPAPAKAGEA